MHKFTCRLTACLLSFLSAVLCYGALPDWVHIFWKDGATDRVLSSPLKSVEDISFEMPQTTDETPDWFESLKLTDIEGNNCNIVIDNISLIEFGSNVPTLYLSTNPEVSEIQSKTDYLDASFSMAGYANYEDVENMDVKIRGRGNTSWNWPKKPYRLKFASKVSLCGLPKAKNYVLIANFIDPTLMRNMIAFESARMLGLPFTNHSVPVNVVLNGVYRGAYMLSEKVGINGASVDIDDSEGILWEIDTNYDEDYKFMSPTYGLPVMVKDPDLQEVAESINQPAPVTDVDGGNASSQITAESLLEGWRSDFIEMENAVKTGHPETHIDMDALARYILVHLVCCNRELNHPKSNYLFKVREGEKYMFGPVWDFDWAFNYYDIPFNQPLFLADKDNLTGTVFYKDLIASESFKTAFENAWKEYREDIFPKILNKIEEYASLVKVSALQNGELWTSAKVLEVGSKIHSSEKFDEEKGLLIDWLSKRIEAIEASETRLLR